MTQGFGEPGAFGRLLQKLKKIPKRTLKGKYYRMVNEEHSNAISETGPSFAHGWRYNPKWEFGALYLADSPEMAWQEKLKWAAGDPSVIRPQVLGVFNLHITRCLDLTSPRVLKTLGLSIEALIQPGHGFTQLLGKAAREQGFEAIKAPSSMGQDKANVVIFTEKITPPSRLALKVKPGRFNPSVPRS